MNNNLKLFAVAAMSAVIGFSANNFAVSDVPSNFKVAVVDVQKVVSSSRQVTALKQEQQRKVAEMTASVKTAKDAIAKEKDPQKKKELEAKYTKTLEAKKTAIEKDYATKLKAIDGNLSAIINAQAKEGNYNIVLSKSVVLSGGDDITAKITALVK